MSAGRAADEAGAGGGVGVAGLVLALAWVAGTALGIRVGPPAWLGVALGVAALLLAAVARAAPLRLAGLALGALALAAARVGDDAGPAPVGAPGPAAVLGRVADAPAAQGGQLAFPLDVVALHRPGRDDPEPVAAGARVLVRAARAEVEIGDLVAASGRLAEPRSRPGWPEREILARRGIGAILAAEGVAVREPAGPSVRGAAARLRRDLEASIRAALPEPHASLVAGVALGARNGLPPDLKADLATTGTSHVVAASGYNLAVVGGATLAVAVRLVGRPWALVPTALAVWAYALLAGLSPSVGRAAMMASLGLGAVALGRPADAATVLAVGAAGLVALDPWLVHDLSFQLSAAATAGLVLFATAIAARLRPLPSGVRAALGQTLAAQVATVPIVLATFHTLSLVAPVANLALAPAIPALTVVGLALGAAGAIPVVGDVLALPALGLANYALLAVAWLAEAPGAAVATGQAPAWLAWAWYAALAAVALSRSPEVAARWGPRAWPRLGSLALLPAVLLATPILARPPTGAVRVSVLDVGAPAVFVRAPSGRTLLATAGAAPSGLAASLAARSGLWEGGPDVAVALRDDERTRAALAAATAGRPAALTIAPPTATPAAEASAATEATAPARGADDATGSGAATTPRGPAAATAPLVAVAGTRIDLGDGVRFVVVDVREEEGRPILDAALVADGLAVWLPGPGAPSPRWRELADETAGRPVVVRLPGRTAAWGAGALPPGVAAWIGDGVAPRAGAGGDDRSAGGARDGGPRRASPEAPLLDHGVVGAVEVVVGEDGLTVRGERCPAAGACALRVDAAGSE